MHRFRRLIVVTLTGVVVLGSLAVFSPTEATTNAKPCRACREQPWCACTYNGHPRVSCDPCCYSTGFGCFDENDRLEAEEEWRLRVLGMQRSPTTQARKIPADDASTTPLTAAPRPPR